MVVGFNYAISGGLPVTLANPASFIHLTLGTFAGLPYPIYVMAIVAAGGTRPASTRSRNSRSPATAAWS